MRRFGLIGKSLTHSFSQKYFEKKFDLEGIQDCRYDLFPLHDISELSTFIQSYPDLEGLNVTIPYKKTIIPYLDGLEEQAFAVGAVNTVKIIKKNNAVYLKGYNTDISGFKLTLKETASIQGGLILGTGGGANAVAYVFSNLNIPFLQVSRKFRGNRTIGYEHVTTELLHDYPFIVNCTPLGMYPEIKSYPPIPYEGLSDKNILYDLIYNPSETEFLRRGKLAGSKVINGYNMLKNQADYAWDIWNTK